MTNLAHYWICLKSSRHSINLLPQTGQCDIKTLMNTCSDNRSKVHWHFFHHYIDILVMGVSLDSNYPAFDFFQNLKVILRNPTNLANTTQQLLSWDKGVIRNVSSEDLFILECLSASACQELGIQ